MDGGWIKLYRGLLDKPIWTQSTAEQKSVLIAIMLLANHQENEWYWANKKFSVRPGQFITSLDSLQRYSGKDISVKNVRTALEKFEKLGFLANQSASTGRLITICNWAAYQTEDETTGKPSGKQLANSRQTTGKEVATNKNDKNDKKDEEGNKQKSEAFIAFENWIKDNAESVGQLPKPFTEDEFLKISKELSAEKIKEILIAMHNYKDLKKKYTSAYLTLWNWSKKPWHSEHRGDQTEFQYSAAALEIKRRNQQPQ